MVQIRILSPRSYSFACVSKVFQPVYAGPKTQNEASISSQKLLIEEGCIQHCGNGLYALLPLAQRALDKLSRLADQEMKAIAAQKLTLPTLTPLQLWKSSGRWQGIDTELMTFSDRHKKQYLLSPTHEEAICELLSHGLGQRQAQLPLLLYQITSKFRDEARPRHALLRSREFVMKDLYSFDVDESSAIATYQVLTQSYKSFLSKIGVPYIRVEGSCGEVGGVYSHEYHYESECGQDSLLRCPSCGHCCSEALLIETGSAAADTPVTCSACSAATMSATLGIEVGHTFLLGTKYSAPLGAVYRNSAGTTQPLVMGCYGLGLTRLVQAAVQRCSGSLGRIVWPWAIAPYRLCIIGPKRGSKESAASVWIASLAQSLQQQVASLRGEVIVDDRDNLTIGARVVAAKTSGYPFVIVVGKSALNDKPLFELIDNTVTFRSLTSSSGPPPTAEDGPVNKGGTLMTQLELINCLLELCDDLQNIRS